MIKYIIIAAAALLVLTGCCGIQDMGDAVFGSGMQP